MSEQTEITTGYAVSDEEKRLRQSREHLDRELAKEIVAVGGEHPQALGVINRAREKLKFAPLTYEEAVRYVGDIVYMQQIKKAYTERVKLESSALPKVTRHLKPRKDLTEKGMDALVGRLNDQLTHLGIERKILGGIGPGIHTEPGAVTGKK